MVARWLLAFAFGFQVTFALAADPVRQNWNTHLKNQYNYDQRTQRAAAEQRASISMTAEKKASVKQTLERSIVFADGSGGKIGASVTKPVNVGKVAETLAERFKNAGKYAKNLGKASIPSFVGMAAFEGLMKGVDYVMDPENNTIQKPNPEYETETTVQPWHQYRFYVTRTQQYVASIAALQKITDESYYESTWTNCALSSGNIVKCDVKNDVSGATGNLNAGYRDANPAYNPNAVNPSNPTLPASDQDIVNALKKALESNNTALAAAIADAMKAAYTQDNSEGQPKTTNPLVADAQNDMQRAVDGAIDTPTTTAGTAERPEGYYKITDGDKTIEGYVRPGDTSATGTTDSTTTPNPDGSSTTTGTASQQWPAFCDWAGIVCEFIDWVKEDEQLKEEKPDDIDDSIFSRKFDFDFKMSANCPPNPIWNFKFIDQSWSKEIDITMICDFFKYLGYAIVFSSNITALWIVYGAVTVREQA